MDNEYERKELAKLRLVIDAAKANTATSGGNKVTVRANGNNPHASITIEAYVFEKFIKEKL